MTNKLVICKLNVYFPGFWKQVIQYSEEFRYVPLLKLWIGPLPHMILYHQDTVEVSPFSFSMDMQDDSRSQGNLTGEDDGQYFDSLDNLLIEIP